MSLKKGRESNHDESIPSRDYRWFLACRDKTEMTIVETDMGLRVRETSSDPYVAKLIKSHAHVLSEFLASGYAEVQKDHPLPERE